MGPDVRIVRRKLGFAEAGSYDRSVQSKVVDVARKAKVNTTGEVNEDVAELLGPSTTDELAPQWYQRDLELADEGPDVATAHAILVPQDAWNDHFGPQLEAAVRRLQSAKGLPVTGKINEEMARHIGEAE